MPSSQQLRPKCQNQVGVILAQFLGSRRALDVYEPAGTAGAPLSPAIRRPAQRQRHHPFVLLWIHLAFRIKITWNRRLGALLLASRAMQTTLS